MGEVEQEINLDEITDEALLQSLLDQTEDVDDRKAIRARIQELRTADKAKREAQRPQADKTASIETRREDRLQNKVREAAEHKQKTLEMYDKMAKSGPAGSNKRMDIGILSHSVSQAPGTPAGSLSGIKASDLVEDGLKQRQRDAEERKKRTLAAFDAAARTGQAGAPKEVDFEAFKSADVSCYEPVKTEGGATFGSSGGIAKVTKEERTEFEEVDGNRTSTVTITKSVTTSRQSNFKSGGGVARSASDIKDMLLKWCRAKTKEYENVEISNFSGSWADGLAFCALIHHFYPDSFDYKELDSKNRRRNFELAFRTAEEKADIYPLIEVEDMILMKNKPDWKCVFTYIQSIYRKLHDLD